MKSQERYTHSNEKQSLLSLLQLNNLKKTHKSVRKYYHALYKKKKKKKKLCFLK